MDVGLVGAAAAGGLAGVLATIVLRRPPGGRHAALERQLAETQARLADRARATAEDREVQALILSSLQDGILLFDETGATAYANEALDRLLGVTPTSLDTLLPLGAREAAKRAQEDRRPATQLVETGNPSRWLRVVATPAGEEGSVLLVVRDVTEARRLDAIRRDFVANASHELKTPAASIQAAAETLRQAARDDPAAVPRFAAQLEREAVRLSRIVADLLDLSRLESGSDLSERLHLDALVREEAQRFERPAREAGLTLVVQTPEPASLRGSGRDLSLLIRNLVDNAIRYTGSGGSVTVEVRADPEWVHLRVVDTGLGIPQRDLPRVFERFYRVDRARSRETGGTGLGLAIVRHVAENHGGSVGVESELGRGTVFDVRLPSASA
jgi:signal transduction histidine kinase